MTIPTILHVDMDCFFVQVERKKDPRLAGLPVVVGGHSVRRGVVSSASYEARAFGVRSAMPLYQARARCPEAILLAGDMASYREASAQLAHIWRSFAPLVEVAGLDEAYLDMSGCEKLMGNPLDMARRLQARILEETGYSSSVGAGTSKLVAKIASKKSKPSGCLAVAAGDEAVWLAPIPIHDLHGVGPAMASKLAQMGLATLAELQQVDPKLLAHYVGQQADALIQLARGIDPDPVTPERPIKSLGSEETFDQDVRDRHLLRRTLGDQCEQLGYRLRRAGLYARTVTLKLRYANFETVTRARTLETPTDLDETLFQAASSLLQQHGETGRAVRLIGVSLSQLSAFAQLSLLEPAADDKKRRLYQAMDGIKDRFGKGAIQRGPGK